MNYTLYKDSDYHELATWFMARRMDIPPKWSFSDTGIVIPCVAAGFLYITNSSLGFLDCFISNPQTSESKRADAIDLIMKRLIAMATDSNIKLLCCSTKFKGVAKIPLRHGFIGTGEHYSLARKI